MATHDPELRAHRDWLGLLQPVGLVVSPPALVKAQAVPSRNVAELQQRLLLVAQHPLESTSGADDEPTITGWVTFFQAVLGWSLDDIAGAPGGPPIPDRLELILPDYDDTLRPTFAVVDSMGDGEPLMLVHVVTRGTPLDEAPDDDVRTGWSASPQARLERLMREVKVRAGVLCNGDAVRLVYAPSGESSGHLTFPVAAMCEVNGRPILAALHMLLSEYRVFSAPAGRRLLDILSESRKYQSEVSNALADQVLGALWELLRGFQASDPEEGRRIFDQTAHEDPQHIYGGLLSLLMRLIFVLYAEDEGLMPEGEVYANNYSVSGLYDRLRSDDGRYPDTMDQRYGAYAWLLSLFQLIFHGGGHAGLRLPTRHGQLFNPDEFPFLAGRPQGVSRLVGQKFEAPRVSDGCIYRVLHALLVLDGERLSYRALDVEQVGSVYEAMMGYEVERASGRCIAVRPKHVVVDVDTLLAVNGTNRTKWVKEQADSELSGASATALKSAATPEDVVAALGRRVSPRSLDAMCTPRLMPPGTLYLQPGEERRRTGSHYTPRELTEPIVRTTLRPVLEALGERPTPEQILNLKICDPAMGSGAFLVEACRQLAERLVTAWEIHSAMPEMPPDEEPLLHARRLVAQRCLYGVDKNPFAVSLAKLSLWLVTLAKDHAFTFIDHALKHGDSLVGLTRKQVAAFHWKSDSGPTVDLFENELKQNIEEALGWRDALQELDEGNYSQKKEAWWEAENALADARLIGDLVVAAFFGADKEKTREELRGQYLNKVEAWRANAANWHDLQEIVQELRGGEKPVPTLHWEIEFPEVFGRQNQGFDAMVGNPPFLGVVQLSKSHRAAYTEYLRRMFPASKGKTDLIAFFFRRSFDLLRRNGAFGLVSTNTISQGDTRRSGLRVILGKEGEIFAARRRLQWPGQAAVVVSVVHVTHGAARCQKVLDGKIVRFITSYLFSVGGDEDPKGLIVNRGQSFLGSKVGNQAFMFDDRSPLANPVSLYHHLSQSDPLNETVLRPYVGAKDLYAAARWIPSRYVIDFGGIPEHELGSWETVLEVLRVGLANKYGEGFEESHGGWWLHAHQNKAGKAAISSLKKVFVVARVSDSFAFTMVSTDVVINDKLVIFSFGKHSGFCVLQSRAHEVWARFFGSTLKDDLQYTPTVCFETFPFPESWKADPALEAAASMYYEYRAGLMVKNNQGLTQTYNRFHDPEERAPGILKLRELHAAMDRVVLEAYGWTDIPTDCEFLLDYEIDEETWGNKKKPYRYRWPDAVHDEVLARLLDLNQKRYAEEVVAGLHAEKGAKRPARKKKARRKGALPSSKATPPLFETLMNSSDDK